MGLWESSLVLPESGNVYTDLLTFAFPNPAQYDEQQPIFIDAEDPSRFLSASQFKQLVRTLIAGLKAHNVQKGDCVLVHLGNNIIYPALFFSIIGAGGVYMGSNPRSQPHELEHILQLAEPKLIITSRDALPLVLDASTSRGMLPSQVCLLDESATDHLTNLLLSGPLGHPAEIFLHPFDGQEALHLNFAHLLCHGDSDWITFNDEQLAKTTPAAMFSTSGTGGLPKAAILSHHAVVSHHLTIHYDLPYRVSRLTSLPMFHLFGALWSHIFPVRYGEPLFVLPRFEVSQFLTTLHRYQISETYMVPAMIHTVNRCTLPVTELMASVRYVGVAGAPIDAASMQHFRNFLQAQAGASQLWGMTEVGVVFQTRYGEQGHTGSIGRLLPGYEIRLVNSEGHNVIGDEIPGELYVRGHGLLLGYKGRDDAKDQQGWFRTGDVAYVKDGLYFVVGRTKELIKVRGWQVAPAELEAVLLKHPGIEDVAVTGVMLRDGSTEVPRAFVKLARGLPANRLTAEEVYMFSRRQLASYKALDGGVIFVEEIPRTASGKIQRFKLSQMNSYREMVASLLSRFEGADAPARTSSNGNNGIQPIGILPEGRVTV